MKQKPLHCRCTLCAKEVWLPRQLRSGVQSGNPLMSEGVELRRACPLCCFPGNAEAIISNKVEESAIILNFNL